MEKVFPWGYITDDYAITGYNGNLNANADYNNAIQDKNIRLGDAYITNNCICKCDVPNRMLLRYTMRNGKLEITWHHDFTPTTFNENYLSLILTREIITFSKRLPI